jgi:hypothetical protein
MKKPVTYQLRVGRIDYQQPQQFPDQPNISSDWVIRALAYFLVFI